MHWISRLTTIGTAALAACGLLAIWSVRELQAKQTAPVPDAPPIPPPVKSAPNNVFATGILEADSENVAVGVPVAGLVQKVVVKVGQAVKKADPLFELDDRDLRAETTAAKAKVEVARAQLEIEQAWVTKLESQLRRWEAAGTRAVSVEEIENRRNDLGVFRARSNASRSEIAAAEADVARLAILAERLVVRAPRDGTVLQVNIREGEYAATSPKTPAMIVGDVDNLQVRADVDEQSAIRVARGKGGVAYLKGNPDVRMPLTFVRIEPYVIPKVSLTGASTERVDTRVLQVIFRLKRPANPPVYVGQQVDVEIESGP